MDLTPIASSRRFIHSGDGPTFTPAEIARRQEAYRHYLESQRLTPVNEVTEKAPPPSLDDLKAP